MAGWSSALMGWFCPHCQREHETTGCIGAGDTVWSNKSYPPKPVGPPEWPSILNSPTIDYEALKDAIRSAVKEALEEHDDYKSAENAKRMKLLGWG